MSCPITGCMIWRATQTEEEFQEFKKIMWYNWDWGAYSHFNVPCEHTPPCEVPTEEQMEALNVRLKEGYVRKPKAMWGTRGEEGKNV